TSAELFSSTLASAEPKSSVVISVELKSSAVITVEQKSSAVITAELLVLQFKMHETDFNVRSRAFLFVCLQMTEYLENSNVSVVSDLHVTSITPAGGGRNLDLKFQVVCGDGDAGAVHAALRRLVDQCADCLGSLRLAGAPDVPEPEPMLHLVELRANIKSGVVREGDDFILSCVARGATSMQFSWYKDGVLINASLARRNMLSQVQSLGKESTWSAVLVVEGTSPMDAGRFTCRVRDAGSEQCRSVDVHVLSPPRLAVRPLVHTVRPGANVTTCCYTGAERLGVTWAKNNHLLALSPGKEVEEDLVYPPGSLLRLYNVTKSATYTCQVMNSAGMSEVESRVDVVGGQGVPECAAEREAGVDWPITPVDREARLECTALLGYTGGVARRRCGLRAQDHHDHEEDDQQDLGHDLAAAWEEPDFSECVQEEFAAIRDNFAGLTLGYANTTALQTLEAVRRWLEARAGDGGGPALRPREGEPVLALAVDVAAYQRKVLGARPLLQLREELFKIVDLLLESAPGGGGPQRSRAVQDNTAIEEVQALVREQALLWASSLPSPLSSASSSVSSSARSAGATLAPHASPAYSQMDVHVVGANDLDEAGAGPREGVPLPDWVGPPGSRLRLHVSKALAQRSVVAAVVAFKSLHKLLPERSVAKMSDSTELEYELASSLVSVSLGSEAGDIITDVADVKDFSADAVFLVTVPGDPDDLGSAYMWPRWAVNCAVTDIARGVTTPGGLPWNTSACSTLGENWDPHELRPGSFSLRCNCSLPGTMAVLLSSNTSESDVPLGPRPPVALVSGLALCALQAAATTLALLPRWLGRPSCMTFLKLQSAAATAASAGIFLSGLSHAASSGSGAGPSGPALVAALHCCLLTALAAHLGKLLLLYTELVGVRPLPQLRQSLLAMVAGAPLVGVLCGLVAARSTTLGPGPGPARTRLRLGLRAWGWGWAPWAPWGDRLCSVLVATAAVILVAFGALLCAVVARLATAPPPAGKSKAAKAAKAVREEESEAVLLRRWGLVKRACCIVLCQVCVVALSIAYVSVKSSVVCFAFSAAAVTLGAVTLFCYVVKPEDAATSSQHLCGGSASSTMTPADASTDPSQTEPLTSCYAGPRSARALWLCLRRSLRAFATALYNMCSRARSYQLVPSRPSGPETPTPARLGVESLCPFIVFTKQDAEIESDAAVAEPEAPASVQKDGGEKTATPNGRHVRPTTSPSRSVRTGRGAGSEACPVCTCHAACSCSCGVGCHPAPLSPARYVPMCPVPCPAGAPVHVHVPVLGAPPGSVLGVGKEASLLVPSPAHDGDAFPLQDLAQPPPPQLPQRSPNKYLYMRCRPYRPEDGDGGDAGPAKYVPRTLCHDWTAVATAAAAAPPPDQPLRPEPVPCYIRGEPGVPVVASPTRRAPPPPRGPGQVLTCKADVEPAPRPSPPPPPLRAPTTAVTPSEDALDEDVLNKISHDLDYLLSGDANPASPAGDAPPSAIAKSALPQP
ncbi:Hemicentin-1, partial [Frankliniella fusca]